MSFDYDVAFSRNIGLVTREEQARLRDSSVAVAGLGGVGGGHALALARLGIGRLALADGDRFELPNLNRQAGASAATLGRLKVDVIAGMVSAVNPTAVLRQFPNGVDETNVDHFLQGAIAVVDGIDFFNITARRLLFRRARALGVYAVTAGPIGFSSTLHVFSPDGMAFDEYFDIRDEMTVPEQLIQFGLGVAPKMTQRRYMPPRALDLKQSRAPSMGSACLLCSALVATEVANLVLRRRPLRVVPTFFQFDPLMQVYKVGRLRWGNRGPVQRLKRWWVLRQNPALRRAIGEAVRNSAASTPPRTTARSSMS